MTTKNIVPQADSEGGIGTSTKKWLNGYFVNIIGNATSATTLATARTINGVSFNGSANITVNPITVFNDTKTVSTAGGTFTSGAWYTRTLNTTVIDQIGITLASNQFTLTAGTYEIDASAPAFKVSAHKIRLRNITDSADIAVGTSENADATYNAQTRSMLNSVFTISATKVCELQHYCASTTATNGFGVPTGQVSEVYTIVKIRRIA